MDLSWFDDEIYLIVRGEGTKPFGDPLEFNAHKFPS
jgi:hypothetical protein